MYVNGTWNAILSDDAACRSPKHGFCGESSVWVVGAPTTSVDGLVLMYMYLQLWS